MLSTNDLGSIDLVTSPEGSELSRSVRILVDLPKRQIPSSPTVKEEAPAIVKPKVIRDEPPKLSNETVKFCKDFN